MFNYGAIGSMTQRAGYRYSMNGAMMGAYAMPYYGFGYGASMFAYGAVARMTARVAYYESYYNGYWGNNPAHYYIGAMGAHARGIAVPGGRPMAAGPAQAANKAAPAGQEAPADRSAAANDAGGADKADKAKDDPEAKEREAAKKALDKARDGAVSKLVNERGYTEGEAKAIVDMVYDKVQNDGKAAPENFASYVNGVPAKMGKDANGRTIKDPTWVLKYGKWAAKLKGVTHPDRAASDTCAEFKVQRGRRLSDKVDYARIEEDGTEKIGDKVYARYRVIKGKGTNGEKLTGRLYYDKDGGKRTWGTKDASGGFVPLRRQPDQHSDELGVIGFGRGKILAVPRTGLSANQINAAIDEWIKRHPAGKKVESPGAGYAKDVKDRLVRFFGTKNGKKVVDVAIDNGKNIVITTAKGMNDTEKGTNAHFVQKKIRDGRGEFNGILKGLGRDASVSIDNEFVSGIGGAGAADSAVEILSKKAVRMTPAIDVRKLENGKDVKFGNTDGDKKLIEDRIRPSVPQPSELKYAKEFVINLRFGKGYAPDAKVIEDIRKKFQEQLGKDGAPNCTVAVKTKEVEVKSHGAPDPVKVSLLKKILMAAGKNGDEADKLLKGSDHAFPYDVDTAIKIAYKKLHNVAKERRAAYTEALKKRGGRYARERADAELTYLAWHNEAKNHLEKSLGKDEAQSFEPDRVKKDAEKPAGRSARRAVRNGGRRSNGKTKKSRRGGVDCSDSRLRELPQCKNKKKKTADASSAGELLTPETLPDGLIRWVYPNGDYIDLRKDEKPYLESTKARRA